MVSSFFSVCSILSLTEMALISTRRPSRFFINECEHRLHHTNKICGEAHPKAFCRFFLLSNSRFRANFTTPTQFNWIGSVRTPKMITWRYNYVKTAGGFWVFLIWLRIFNSNDRCVCLTVYTVSGKWLFYGFSNQKWLINRPLNRNEIFMGKNPFSIDENTPTNQPTLENLTK